jgi:prepilin-type N-terminal cleavage/methylation domain
MIRPHTLITLRLATRYNGIEYPFRSYVWARRCRASLQAGFTLVELMIALVLGLLISAAGLSIFLSSQRAFNLHESMGALQQNANFALAVFTQDLRHANLNTASDQKINNKIVGAGIILPKKMYP